MYERFVGRRAEEATISPGFAWCKAINYPDNFYNLSSSAQE
jgi:hypothetical protein